MGVTGGSGSGKSYLTGLLDTPTAHIIDMDKLGHATLTGMGYQPVVDAFGSDILVDGLPTSPVCPAIDRKKLGAIVFADPDQLAKLNAIVHPLIRQQVYQQVLEALPHYRLIILDGALLFAAHLHLVCDMTVLVLADMDTRCRRIMARDHLTQDQALTRLNSQADYHTLIEQATVVVYNN